MVEKIASKKPHIISAISDVILTDLSTKLLFNKKDEYRCIQSFEIENDSISKLYEIKIVINAPSFFKEADMPKALGEFLQFEVEQDKIKNYYSGIIVSINFLAFKSNKFYQYEIIMRPYLWNLTQNNGYRCWVDKSTKDIINTLLKEKYKSIIYEFHTPKSGELLTRKNTIQYGETDFEFLCRLLQEDGLNFIIEQTQKGQNVVFSDDIETFFQNKNKKFPPTPTIMQISASNLKYDNNHSSFFGYRHSIIMNTTEVTTSFADSRNFGNLISSKSNIEKQSFFKWETHPNLNKSSKILETSSSWPNKESIRKNSMGNFLKVTERIRMIRVGEELSFIFTKNEQTDGFLDPSIYYAAMISHKYSRLDPYGNHYPSKIVDELIKVNSNYMSKITSYPKNENLNYLENFDIQKLKINFPSTITATVFGEQKSDLKIERKDAGILIGISFFWQTKDKEKELKCSQFVWARLSQFWASKNYGALFIPQPGDEVVVSIIDNDIENLVIIASLYNSKNLAPQNLNEQKRGLIANEELEESIQLGIKSNESLVIFNEKSLETTIKKDKVKLIMDDNGLFYLHSEDAKIEASKTFKVVTDDAEIKASNEAKINKLKVKS